jgi:putative membrane protein
MPINKKIPTSHILNEVKVEILYALMIGLSVLFVTPKLKAVVPKMPIAIAAFFGTAISVIVSIKLINRMTVGGKPEKLGQAS